MKPWCKPLRWVLLYSGFLLTKKTVRELAREKTGPKVPSLDTMHNEQKAELNPKGTLVFSHGPMQHNALLGLSSTFVFIGSWFLSVIVIPIIFIYLILIGDKERAGVLVAIVLVCFFPFPNSPLVRRFCSEGGTRYFHEASLLIEEPIVDPQNPKKLLCVHPHGIVSMGWAILYNRIETVSMNFCFSRALFYSPLFGLLTRVCGHPHPADKANFKYLMKQQKTMALIPGGFEEATITTQSANRVYLKKRKGFVKYALQSGYALIPSFVFGENQTYYNFQGFWSLRFTLNSFGIPAVAPIGKWWCPLMPRNESIHIVVGKALELPCIEHPSREQITEHHARYIEALVALYDRHKATYGCENTSLEVW
jgi:2-acylglycerol O-acyltransferase 2